MTSEIQNSQGVNKSFPLQASSNFDVLSSYSKAATDKIYVRFIEPKNK